MPPGITTNITTTVSIPGGGPYTLTYKLRLGNPQGPPNSWRATIAAVDGSFSRIVLESITDYSNGGFDPTYRELGFSMPNGTTVVKLTFEGTQVFKHDHVASRPCSPAFAYLSFYC